MKQLIENLRDNRVEVGREEWAAALENLTAEIDKNGEHLRYVEGLETMNCARIRELQAKNSALADEVGDYAKENVVLTAERDALEKSIKICDLAFIYSMTCGFKLKREAEAIAIERDALKAALQLIKANTNTADWPDDINAAIQGAGK